MRTILISLAALGVCLLATACGSVRAIQGDFASKAPRLIAVSPTQVASGQFVDIKAQVIDQTGGSISEDEEALPGQVGDLLYFWDFGGAAEPNTSTVPEPRVQIRSGAGSPYNATLTLTDPTASDDDQTASYDFQIFVAALSVADVTPQVGTAGSNAVFSALVDSGIPQRYQWDFGGAASPAGSTDPSPAVTLTDAPGTYNARVIVSNAFEAEEFMFTIQVLPGTPAP